MEKQAIKEIIAKILGCEIDKVKDESMLISELMVDSLAIAKIAVEIEDHYDITLDEDLLYPFEDISVDAFYNKIKVTMEG